MVYPQQDQEMIAATMLEERGHQGLGDDVARRNLEYLRKAAPRAADFISVTRRYAGASDRTPRAVELGSGNGWVSWLLAEAGFDTWMCDFEANTLLTGMNLKHANLPEGRRFVTDARFAPFESGSFDLVVFKEFVHHVEAFTPLFREANRLLRPGGTVAMVEPVRSLSRSVRELKTPDPHEGHHITWPDRYLRGLRTAGFEIVHEQPVYDDQGNTKPPMAWMKKRAIAAIDDQHPSGDWVSKLQLRVFGGAQLMMIGQKVRDLPIVPRPSMNVIDPESVIATETVPAPYEEFPTVLRSAAAGFAAPSVSG